MTDTAQAAPAADYAALADDELVALIFREGDRLPMEWAREAVSRGQRLVPLLAAAAVDRASWERDDARWWATVHACFILGAIGGGEAIAALLTAFELSAEHDVDWLFEEWPSIFGRLGPGVLGGLKHRVTEGGVEDEFWTDRLMAGMAAVASRHPERREEVFSFIAGVAADEGQDEACRVRAGAILLDFRLEERRGLLLELAALDGNDTFRAEDVEEALSLDEPDLTWYQRDWLEFYRPDRVAERQERWREERFSEEEAWYDAVAAAADRLEDQPALRYREAEARLGELRPLADGLRGLLELEVEELDKARLLECRALAMELRAAVLQDPARWRLIEGYLGDADLGLWLIDIPNALAEEGLPDEAESLALALADLRAPDAFLCDRARILARAGRAPEARAQLRLVRRVFGDDFWTELRAGKVYARLGDWDEAESVLYMARFRAPSPGAREEAARALAEALRAAGKAAEAERVEAEERELLAEADGPEPWLPEEREPVTFVRQGEKVGRNEPCPCGSGKKHKKCCL